MLYKRPGLFTLDPFLKMIYLLQLSHLIWSCSIQPCCDQVYALLQAIDSCIDVSVFAEQHNSYILIDTEPLPPITEAMQYRFFHDINKYKYI